MKNSKTIGGLVLGAAVGLALYKFFKLPKEERNEIMYRIKETTNDLLDNAEDTVEKVEQYISEINSKGKGEWIDKMYVLRKMFKNFYGSAKNYLL